MDRITIVTLIFIAAGIVLTFLGVPLYQRRIPPNPWYGCRTEKSLSDEAIWYAVNRVTGRDLIVAGLLVLVASLLVFPFRHQINENYAIGILLATLLLSVVRMVIHSFQALKSA
jgi:uncharacterized membrane protein